MAGEAILTRSALLISGADNTTRKITPVILRDFMVSTIGVEPLKLITSGSSPYTATQDDTIIEISGSGNFVINLPSISTALSLGKKYIIKKTNDEIYTVTLSANGAERIDRATTYVMKGKNNSIGIFNCGAEWDVYESPISTDNLGNIVMPRTSGTGIKVDTNNPDWGWKDLIGNITSRSIGGTVPGFNLYRGTIYQYQVDSTDTLFNEFHVPHDWVPGTDWYIHAHWSQNLGALTNGLLTWSFDISYANGYERGVFSAPITVSASLTPTVLNQYEHYINEVKFATPGGTGGLLDSNNMEVDGLILVRTNWITNTLNPATNPFLHYVDLHYQSNQMATKGRNYPFYT